MVNIILGLIKPDYGQVLVDKKDIHLNLKPWHSNIGFIPQEIYLLDDTILNNIFGSPKNENNLEKVKMALKSAEIYDFVINLPEGLETNVGEKESSYQEVKDKELVLREHCTETLKFSF